MKWARGRTADGSVITGILAQGALHPRVALGSETSAGAPVPLEDVTLLAPVVPGKFIGLWNNFGAAAEKNGHQRPQHPLYFLKPDTALSGPDATVVLPVAAGRVVFEGELGIVIGQTCRAVTVAQAEAAILGYTCVNDFTSLDVLNADPSFPQWTRAKGFDGFGVAGPVIETEAMWRDLEIKVMVDGRERQSYSAADMILTPPQIVSLLSQDMTLNAGDLIACGTSLGARPVKTGQRIEVVIEGVGTLGVTMAAPEAQDHGAAHP